MTSMIEYVGGQRIALPTTTKNWPPARHPRGLTYVEVMVVTLIIAIGLALLIPAVQSARERNRRQTCLNRAHTIEVAMQEYAGTYANAFPPSAQLYGTSSAKHVGGYSFLVKILSFMDHDALYKTLPQNLPNGDLDALAATSPALATAMNTSLAELVCPSNRNRLFQNPTASPPQFAFTNYKASGATTRDSLLMAANPSAPPPYGAASLHPDGTIFPAGTNLPLSSIVDGMSHTILIMETMDGANSRWIVGNECTLVGMPQGSGATEKFKSMDFYAPPGFDNTFGDDSGVARRRPEDFSHV